MLLNRLRKKLLITLRLILVLGLVIYLVPYLVPYKELEDFRNSYYSISIQDVNGIELYVTALDNGLKRFKVDEKSIPKEIKRIILKSEDRFYYFHFGINPVSIIRTLYYNIKEDRVISGASTISMQLARMITPRDKSIGSKILEMLDAFRIEIKLSKSEILSLYLSHIPFGKNMEGYEAASKRYYGKGLKELDEYETRLLSIIPRSPGIYDPTYNRDGMIRALSRTDSVIFENYKVAFDLIYSKSALPINPIEAPHFVNFVIKSLDEADYRSGKSIITTLDINIQRDAQDLLNLFIDDSVDNRLSNGALLLTYKGDIITYIGSGDFFDVENQGQIDGVQILRQPGSTLKPYLYELAFENGFTPASILPDIPTVFGQNEIYRPENYSQTYNGPVTIRTALASSLNIPAVYMLERLSVDSFIKRLKLLGFNSLIGQEDRLGLGLAVGNAEVSLFELVRGFRVFKNSGNYQDLNWKMGVENKKTPVMDKVHASITRDILSDRQSRVLGFGRRSVLNTEYPSYFKTGTSNQFTNIWALGATEDLTCGVWMGNFSGNSVIGTPGSSIPAKVVERLLGELSSKNEFEALAGVLKAQICSLSGGLYTENCLTKREEFFKDISELRECTFHKDNHVVILPAKYSQWLSIYSYNNLSSYNSERNVVLSPQDGAEYFYTPDVPETSQGIEFQILGNGPFTIYGNGDTIYSGNLPYQGIIYLERGSWTIDVETDSELIKKYIKIK